MVKSDNIKKKKNDDDENTIKKRATAQNFMYIHVSMTK